MTTLSFSIKESQPSNPSGSRSPALPSWVDGPAKGPKTIGTVGTTAQVHPQLFTKALLCKAVEQHGVEVVIGKLERIEAAEERATAVVLEGGRQIETDAVVLALGQIQPREVYICGMSANAEVPDDPEQIAPVPESIAVLKRVAGNVSSHLVEGEAAVKAEQACFLPCTDDSVPVIGEVPGVKGCYVATGHSCWGILNGPATGASMAELVMDGRSSIVDLSAFSPSRFVRAAKS
nr:putative oxidoreductase TDA3 [Ipomoea batatas]